MREHDDSASPRFAETYDALRRIAGRLYGDGGDGVTLQPTAIVHEAWLKLAGIDDAAWESESHFVGVAAKALRQVLADHARGKRRLKRGGGARQLSLDTSILGGETPRADARDLDEALRRLESQEPRAASVVELRFFGGLTNEQVATHLGLSVPTVERDWRFARAQLYVMLRAEV